MNTITDVLKNNGQQEVLELISQGKQFPQLEKLDLERLLKNAKLSVLSKSIKSEEISTDRIEELPVQDIPAIERQKDTFYKLGMAQLRKQRLGVVILSGGQGSRLGFDHAKGMFDVGVRRSVSIFELLVESLSKLTEEIGAPVPLFLMTSRENNEEVQQFFRQHKYFGYPVDYVDFFVQNEYPALDRKANLYVNQAGKLHMLPSGNGDWYESLAASGILSKPHFAQVEWLNVVAVDNPLQNMADPVFLGAMLASHCLARRKSNPKSIPGGKGWYHLPNLWKAGNH